MEYPELKMFGLKWPDGPREWSPRLAQAEREVEKLRLVIPASLIVEQHDHWKVGEVIPIRCDNEEFACKFALLVKLPEPVDVKGLVPPWKGLPGEEEFGLVWLYSDGYIYVDRLIYYLLTGQVKGYEHLAGRWPWGELLGPPDPNEKAAHEEVMGDGAFSSYGGEG